MEGLSFRIPLVCVPRMAEQRTNADRVVELGLGVSLDPAADANTLWAAVDGVATEMIARERLVWMEGEIAAAGGSVAAADEVERVLAELSYRPRRPRRRQPLSDHRNTARQPISPPMVHAVSTRKIRPCSQLPAGSSMTISAGRSTERNPCAIHLTGKSEPTISIQAGRTMIGT